MLLPNHARSRIRVERDSELADLGASKCMDKHRLGLGFPLEHPGNSIAYHLESWLTCAKRMESQPPNTTFAYVKVACIKISKFSTRDLSEHPQGSGQVVAKALVRYLRRSGCNKKHAFLENFLREKFSPHRSRVRINLKV
jgi:hypothetical protein